MIRPLAGKMGTFTASLDSSSVQRERIGQCWELLHGNCHGTLRRNEQDCQAVVRTQVLEPE